MSWFSFCKKDPVLEFIRDTYDAIPLKVPDDRISVLTVFASAKGQVRYLGNLADLSGDSGWEPPPAMESELPDISNAVSSKLDWKTALNLIGPFLSELSELSSSDIEASLDASGSSATAARIRINRAHRQFVHPIPLATSMESGSFRLPSNLGYGSKGTDDANLYVVDGALSAKDVSIEVTGESSQSVAAKLAVDFSAKMAADNLLASKTKLKIGGDRRIPFAFTCLKLESGDSGIISGLALPEHVPAYGATALASATTVTHEVLGEPHQMVAFE